MPTLKISYKIILLLMLAPFLANAAKQRFGQITIKEGLSQSTVKSIHQDYRGFLWFGSADGLNRFDGYKLTVYRNDPTDYTSLTDNDISCIFENRADSLLWIGTQGEGLNLYDRKYDRFIIFKYDPNNIGSLPDNDIRCMISDNDGKLWIGTQGGGFCYWNAADSSFVRPEFASQPVFGDVFAMANYRAGAILLGTGSGVYMFAPGTGKTPQAIQPEPGFSAPAHALLYDIKGNLWIGTQGKGLVKYQPDSRKTEYYLNGNQSFNAIIQRKNGSVWVASGNGLFRYEPHQNNFSHLKNDPINPESINDEIVFSLFEDRSEILWIGTFIGGVNQLDPEGSRFEKYHNFVKNRPANNANNNINGIYTDLHNTVWVATSKGLIALPEAYFSEETATSEIAVYFDGTDQDNVFGDSRGNIYVSNQLGVFILKNGSGQFQEFTPVNADKFQWFSNFNSMFEDSERNIWIATLFGLLKYNPASNTLELKNPDGKENNRTNFLTVTESRNGSLWLGSFNGELYVFDRNTEKFQQILPNSTMQAGTVFNRIFSVCGHRPGEIWFGTNNGLYLYNEQEQKLYRYLTSDGLSNNVVYAVVTDEKGRIWCSTNLGVSAFQTSTRTFTNYTWENGLQSNEFNQNAWFKNKNGLIYFGGIDGFNIIDPNRLSPNQYVPNVLITGLMVNHQNVAPGTHPKISAYQTSEAKTVKLTHKQSVFTFEFTALNFILPNKNQYRYMLKGYESKWVEAKNQRTASYTNLDPGTYTFMVMGSNNDGVWNETPATLQVIILPPFWRTWWFKLLLTLAAVFTVYLVFYLRLKGIKQERALLEKLVTEKTAALSEQNIRIEQQNKELVHINEEIVSRNEKIGQKNNQLEDQNKQIVKQRDNLLALAEQVQEANQAKINFFTTISHEFRTPLTLIIGPLKELILRFDDLNKAELQRKFKIIYGNASKLLLLVNELLDFRKADTADAGLNRTRTDLVLFVQQIAWLFNDIAQRKKINFRFESTHKTIENWVDTQKIEKIVFNLVSNAFKFTPDYGQITIGIDKISTADGESSVVLKVTDSGKGIPEDEVNKIFDTFYQADHTQNLQQSGSGLGLALVQKYTELHGGNVEVKSKLGAGTTFIIKLPVVAEENTVNEPIGIALPLPAPDELLIASIDEYSPVIVNDLKTGREHTLPRLLLVEDDHNLRAYLKEILAPNYRVDEADSADTGFQLADTRHPDLIICDVMLQNISGFELCRKIKAEFKTCHIPVILLTSLADLPNQMTGLKSGADAFITKPFDLQYLYLTIENLITQRRKLQNKFYHGTSLESTEYSMKAEDQQFLDKVIAQVEQNLTDSAFDVEKLCENIRLSQPQTYRKIKALTDLSITEFIRNIRLKKAAQLLAAGNKTISEVAYEVGFSDPNYFSKCFVKVYGQTPSEFLKLKG